MKDNQTPAIDATVETTEQRLAALEGTMNAIVREMKALRTQTGIPQTPSPDNEEIKRRRAEEREE